MFLLFNLVKDETSCTTLISLVVSYADYESLIFIYENCLVLFLRPISYMFFLFTEIAVLSISKVAENKQDPRS